MVKIRDAWSVRFPTAKLAKAAAIAGIGALALVNAVVAGLKTRATCRSRGGATNDASC
jgi:hypothetical protein